ncbi:serum response factor-like isoform X1 [Ostrea edulis]|uniref:serum response factor-like isoform X1 n=1 Tax=Ostrea edulis TaxID=37623 RepID=UPI0024AF273A|nr:serum response factor-like isoform X1 [Ostrea edulis]
MKTMNGTHLNQPAFPTAPGGGVPTFTMENVDPSGLEEESDSDGEISVATNPQGLKPGKKTKGRVKIKMEFIENKLRRYTTFSKRKTGIMKKAYELSTLTGTQVMLLVASETGHVYTFATRKLQPMITSDSGKALIQTCLNSPDPPPGSQPQITMDQRMNPTGFEETELSYAVGDEDHTKVDNTMKPMFMPMSIPETGVINRSSPDNTSGTSSPPQQSTPSSQTTQQATPTSSAAKNLAGMSNVNLTIPGLPPGAVLVPQGAGSLIPIQQNGQQMGQSNQAQTLYRLPNSNHIVALSNAGTDSSSQQPQATSGSSSDNMATLTNVSTAGLQTAQAGTQNAAAMTPGVVMYHTPQGIVYAPTTLQDASRSVFNFQQTPTALSLPQSENGQQIITIPIPVSLAGTGNSQVPVYQFATQVADTSQSTLSQPTPAKKSKK